MEKIDFVINDDINSTNHLFLEYRPFTPPPPRERLSYTRYQLELLNGIYNHVRYPNSTQKQLIAKRVGITREQVKVSVVLTFFYIFEIEIIFSCKLKM